MTRAPNRRWLRWSLLPVAACTILIGGYLIARSAREADRAAVQSAYEHGRLTREQAIDDGLSPDDPVFQKTSD